MKRPLKLSKIPVSMLIGSPVITVDANFNMWAVAQILANADVGLLVVQMDGATVGVVSERDVVHALANHVNLSTTRALDIASTHVIWCDEDSTVDEVAAEMADNYVRHILVEREGQLVGVVSARDLLAWYAQTSADFVDAMT